MASGGARNRSGPPADPSSATSDRRGFSLTALPAEGYTGPIPDFPLLKRNIYYTYFEGDGKDRRQVRELDEGPTEQVWERELALWAWLWRTPQACAWSMPSESWRLYVIAMYVRTFVLCEGDEATAADKNSLHRFADQIGMTTAGLAEMGWRVAVDQLGAKRAEASASDAGPKRERRLAPVADAQQ